MTIEEFVRARTASDGRTVVLVSEHKTGAQGPAQLALETSHYRLFNLFAKRLTAKHIFVYDLVIGLFSIDYNK